jgi:multiple sugar transport system permease protein
MTGTTDESRPRHARVSRPPAMGEVKVFFRRHHLERWVFLVVTLALVVVLLFPILWMIRISLTPDHLLFILPPKNIFKNINLNGYIGLFSRIKIGRFYFNSVAVAFGTVLTCVFCGTLAGYSFSRFKYKGRNTLMVITLSAQMFPWAMLIISLYILYIKTKLLDSYIGLILAHSTFALPLTIWIIKGYFDTIPKELEESAFIDGCSRMRTLLNIVLPLTTPGVLAAAIYVFLFSWNDFLFGLTLTTTDRMRTLAPGITMKFIGEWEYHWVDMMSTSISITIPVVVLFLFLQRYFIEGLTAGALKD